MAAATIKGFIQARKSEATGHVSYSFTVVEDMTRYGYMCVMPYEIIVEIPAGFSVEASQAAALESMKRQRLADLQEVEAQIAKLAPKAA